MAVNDQGTVSQESPSFRILTDGRSVERFVAEISNAADKNRESFGFLPAASYAEAAARGRLWVATDHSGGLAGYLFFGGRFPNISVTQLFVAPSARRARVGRRLIEELKFRASSTGVQTISARVAADLEANAFWESCGFIVLRQIDGGATKNRRINVRIFEVPDCSLWPAESKPKGAPLSELRPTSVVPNYVIDLNVFFDLVRNRVDTESARRLVGAAMANALRICVTSEFATELKRRSSDPASDPILRLALSLPVLPRVPAAVLSELLQGLKGILFTEPNRSAVHRLNDDSDLVHLATCVHHRTSAFVTRDRAILRSAEQLQQKFGLEVVSIDDVLQDLELPIAPAGPVTADVDGQSVSVSAMREEHRSGTERLFRELGISGAVQTQVLDPGTSHSPRLRIVAFSGEVVVGYCCFHRRRTELEAFVLVDERAGVAQRFVDHVIQRVAHDQPSDEPCLISIQTIDSQKLVASTALERSYLPIPKSGTDSLVTLRRVGYRGIVGSSAWGSFGKQLQTNFGIELPTRIPTFDEARNTGVLTKDQATLFASPRRLIAFETFFAPLLLLLQGRPGAIVPIREPYAQELLQLPVPQMSLLPGKEAQFRVERAYFGRPGFEKTFVKGGLVVFYVSGGADGRMSAVGIARVTFSGRVTIDRASREFLRYGVIEGQTLRSMANAAGVVGMFSFDSFFPFAREVPYSELRAMDCVGGANLVTAQRLTESQLSKIVAAGQRRS